MSAMDVRRMDAAQQESFFALHCDANEAGLCFCVAWWVPTWDGWGERTAQQNRALRESLFAQGQYDGYLLYVDGIAAGWSQVGPRDRLSKLVGQYELVPDERAWAISCFLIAPGMRGRGLSQIFLQAILADLRTREVDYVQAFPRRGPDLDVADLWRGPESIYQKAGFRLERDDPRTPLYRMTLGVEA